MFCFKHFTKEQFASCWEVPEKNITGLHTVIQKMNMMRWKYFQKPPIKAIHTRQEYPKEWIQPEIKPENRTGTIEQLKIV